MVEPPEPPKKRYKSIPLFTDGILGARRSRSGYTTTEDDGTVRSVEHENIIDDSGAVLRQYVRTKDILTPKEAEANRRKEVNQQRREASGQPTEEARIQAKNKEEFMFFGNRPGNRPGNMRPSARLEMDQRLRQQQREQDRIR
jgi:hypothetical protein